MLLAENKDFLGLVLLYSVTVSCAIEKKTLARARGLASSINKKEKLTIIFLSKVISKT